MTDATAVIEVAHSVAYAVPAAASLWIARRKEEAPHMYLVGAALAAGALGHVENSFAEALQGSPYLTESVKAPLEFWGNVLSLTSSAFVTGAVVLMKLPSLKKAVMSRLIDSTLAIVGLAAITPAVLISSFDSVSSTLCVIMLGFLMTKRAWANAPLAASAASLTTFFFSAEQTLYPIFSHLPFFTQLTSLTGLLFAYTVVACELESSPTEPPPVHGAVVTA